MYDKLHNISTEYLVVRDRDFDFNTRLQADACLMYMR